MVMADGMEHVAHLSDICLFELRPRSFTADNQHLRVHRTVRLRFRFHRIYVIPDLFLRRRAQNGPLCHLYRLYGAGNDASGHGCGLASGNNRIPPFLCVDDDMLHSHHCSMRVHTHRPELRKEKRTIKEDVFLCVYNQL